MFRRPPAAGEVRPPTARIASPGCGRGDPGRRPGGPTGTNRPRGTDPGAAGPSDVARTYSRAACLEGKFRLPCVVVPGAHLSCVVGRIGSSCRARVRFISSPDGDAAVLCDRPGRAEHTGWTYQEVGRTVGRVEASGVKNVWKRRPSLLGTSQSHWITITCRHTWFNSLNKKTCKKLST